VSNVVGIATLCIMSAAAILMFVYWGS